MAVRTDDGRSVAFDTKDYAHIDHGYAATIHKAQGMTVDRAHVLATPGMDSHGAYVGLSRHRDGVALHYGRDDFADQSKLVRTLSRERGKDMASDYKPERQFAERRGITFRERIVEIARQVPERAKSIFASFRPQAQKLEVCRPNRPGCPISAERSNAMPVPPPTSARCASRIYPSCHTSATRWRRPGRLSMRSGPMPPPISPAPCSASPRWRVRPPMAAARAQSAPCSLKPKSASIPRSAPTALSATGSGWGRLRQTMQRDGDTKGAQRLTNRMTDMAKGLERDAQVESLLRGRTRELGIKTELGRDLARDLAASMSMERSRSIGMGL
jgi:hypothetical protein